MKMKRFPALLLFSILCLTLVLGLPRAVSAHLGFKPSEVPVSTRQTFTLSVPSEREQPTVSLKLLIPPNITGITPVTQSGWTIATEKNNNHLTAIEWREGSIPTGQMAVFSFDATVPTKTATIIWKAYQTYADGTIVAWDTEPTKKKKHDDMSTTGPYSTTVVVDDITQPKSTNGTIYSPQATIVYILSIAALALSGVALIKNGRRRESNP